MTRSPAHGPAPGLCGSCRHVRRVRSGKGSTFFLCRRAATDPRFRKYPPIPVLSCVGWEPDDEPAPRTGEDS
ncbi:MAG: hypothetical protein EA351_05835 [Gemmatimonadales bacterium]|nr:MAG: hypothetical protein EA351_05835 [Gemmatimonadales bacterium]